MDETTSHQVAGFSNESVSRRQSRIADRRESFLSGGMAIAWVLAAVAVLVQMLTDGRYGYFRDELYYIATSNHLAFGYVDFAPLAAWVLRVNRALFGESLHALRLLPALAGGAQIVLTGLIARELGGKKFAMFLACVSVLVAPVVLVIDGRYSMNVFEPLSWMGCVYFLLLAINRNQPKLLVWCGVLLGLGLENKHSTVFFLFALLVGIVATSDRRLLKSKWLWIAVGIAFLISLPNLVWQYQHGFPTWVDLNNVRKTGKNTVLPPLRFLLQQVLMLNPAGAIVWIAGLGFLLFHREGKRYRSLGVTYLAFLAVMMALHAKDYYLAPIYPMLFAAGGVYWEELTRGRAGLRWVRVAIPALVLVMGATLAPLVIPILPIARVVPYIESLGIKLPHTESHDTEALPQHFADEFGWPEMVASVADVYNAMPPEERAKTGILAGNYGEAGAIDFFGLRYGLPKSISAHQNYYYWGPRNYTGESLILLQWDLDDAQRYCESVEKGPTLDPRYGMDEEHYTILVCHGLRAPLASSWPKLKHWN
jgi:Dolichyl-phosphate-mannose-protein mannosyltransferase